MKSVGTGTASVNQQQQNKSDSGLAKSHQLNCFKTRSQSQLVTRYHISASYCSDSKQPVKYSTFGEAPASVSDIKLVIHAVLMHLDFPEIFPLSSWGCSTKSRNMEHSPNSDLWACWYLESSKNIWLKWVGFAGSAGILLRKARAVLTSQHQSPLQRLPILPELSFKKWSCPEASILAHQGLSLTPWCQKSQLKFNELAQGLIPCLHPAPAGVPAHSPSSHRCSCQNTSRFQDRA